MEKKQTVTKEESSHLMKYDLIQKHSRERKEIEVGNEENAWLQLTRLRHRPWNGSSETLQDITQDSALCQSKQQKVCEL